MYTLAPDSQKRGVVLSSSSAQRKLNFINEILAKKLGGNVNENETHNMPHYDALSNNFTNMESSLGKNVFLNLLINEDEEYSLIEETKNSNISSFINEMNKKKRAKNNFNLGNGNKTNKARIISKQNNSTAFASKLNNSSIINNSILNVNSNILNTNNKDNATVLSNNLNLKTNLDFAEIKGIKIVASKVNFSPTTVNDTISISSGLIRFNITENALKNILGVISSYEKLVKTVFRKLFKYGESASKIISDNQNIKEFSIAKNLYLKETYEIRKLIASKTKTILKQMDKNKESFNMGSNEFGLDFDFDFLYTCIKEYSEYINNEVNNYDKVLLADGRHEVNYLFNILNKSRIELNLNVKDVVFVIYNIISKVKEEKPRKLSINNKAVSSHNKSIDNQSINQSVLATSINHVKMLGKLIMPSPNMKFKLNPSKIYFSFMDIETEYYDLDSWRKIISTLVDHLEANLKQVKYYVIKPFIEDHLKELLNEYQVQFNIDQINQFNQNQNNILKNNSDMNKNQIETDSDLKFDHNYKKTEEFNDDVVQDYYNTKVSNEQKQQDLQLTQGDQQVENNEIDKKKKKMKKTKTSSAENNVPVKNGDDKAKEKSNTGFPKLEYNTKSINALNSNNSPVEKVELE